MQKIILLITTILLISSCGTSKNAGNLSENQQSIKSDFISYLDAIISKDFDKSMDYIIPEFFDLIPKSMMIDIMEETFNNPEMEFDLKEPKIMYLGKIKNVEGRYYSKLKYSNLMDVKFIDDEEEEETTEVEGEEEMLHSLMMLSFEKTFGKGNVTYDETNNIYKILSKKDVIAISDNGKSDWKFLVIEEAQRFLLEELVPKQVIDMK